LKILQVYPFFYPAWHYGGVTLAAYQIAKHLAEKGHEVTVYTTDALDGKSRVKTSSNPVYIDNIEVCYFRNLSNFLCHQYYLPLPLGMPLKIKDKIKKFDVIHLHGYRHLQNIIVHHYAQKYGIPYVVDPHGALPILRKGVFKRFFDVIGGDRLLKDASRVIGETEVGVIECKKAGVAQDKIVLLPPPPCDVDEFSQLPPSGLFRHKYNIKENHIIMFLGRIHWVKGLDFLVESFYELAQERTNVILVIVGPDDGYKSTLDKMIENLHLSDRVLFTGFLGGKEKLSALVDASIVVQTSRSEQGAGAPLEGVLCNTPIIVSRDTGAGEDVSRMDAGYLVEFGNKDDLRKKIEYVLDNQTEAKDKAEKAKEYIEANLSMARKIEEYENLYASCIEESKHIARRKK